MIYSLCRCATCLHSIPCYCATCLLAKLIQIVGVIPDLVGDVDICWKVVEFSFPKEREHVKAKFISVAHFIPRVAQVFFTKVK